MADIMGHYRYFLLPSHAIGGGSRKWQGSSKRSAQRSFQRDIKTDASGKASEAGLRDEVSTFKISHERLASAPAELAAAQGASALASLPPLPTMGAQKSKRSLSQASRSTRSIASECSVGSASGIQSSADSRRRSRKSSTELDVAFMAGLAATRLRTVSRAEAIHSKMVADALKTVQSEAPSAVREDAEEDVNGDDGDEEENDEEDDLDAEVDEEDDDEDSEEQLEEMRRRKSTILEHENNIQIAEIANAKIVAARLSQQVKKLERKLERMRKSIEMEDSNEKSSVEEEDAEFAEEEEGAEKGEREHETPEEDNAGARAKRAYIAKLQERLRDQRSGMRRLRIRRRSSASTLMIEVNELSDMFNIDGFASYCDTKTGERKMPG